VPQDEECIGEREALAAILQEQNLGASDLADPGARIAPNSSLRT
jgi:hypothetical protein